MSDIELLQAGGRVWLETVQAAVPAPSAANIQVSPRSRQTAAEVNISLPNGPRPLRRGPSFVRPIFLCDSFSYGNSTGVSGMWLVEASAAQKAIWRMSMPTDKPETVTPLRNPFSPIDDEFGRDRRGRLLLLRLLAICLVELSEDVALAQVIGAGTGDVPS